MDVNDSTTTGSNPPMTGAAQRAGNQILGILYLFTLGVVCVNSGDWVHLLWSVQFSLAGLFLGAGLLLVQVWPDQRRQHPAPFWGRNGASVALLAAVVLGSLPILFALLPLNIYPVGPTPIRPALPSSRM